MVEQSKRTPNSDCRIPNLVGVALLFFAVPVTAIPAAVWDREASVQWSAVSLGEVLERFGETQKIGVFLDRRIDPSRTVEFTAVRRPIGALLDEFAASLDLGCCRLDSVAYLGPKFAAATLAQRQPPTVALLRRRVPLEIPFLATPKEVLEHLAESNGLRFRNLETLPHDLWPERKLPPTALFQLFDLLLVGFDATFELESDGKTLCIVPLRRPDTTAAVQSVPNVPQSPVPLSRQRLTLTIKDQELDGVLRVLAERIGLHLEIDEASLAVKNVSLRHRVSYEAKNATVQELFRGLLSPLKLEFTIRGETIRIR